MIRTSEATSELMAKLSLAQSKMGVAIKASTAQGEKFSYKYADLSAIIDATMEHLNGQGIAVMQHPSLEYKTMADMSEAFVTVTTRLQLGPEWMESDMSVPALMRGRFDAQSVGSAITYACRYALQAIFIVPREDDDGVAATGKGTADAAKAVGAAKVEELRKGRQIASKAQETPSQLCVYPLGEGFEVTGEPETMNAYKGMLLAYGKKTGQVTVLMSAEKLDGFKFEFENSGGILTTLKGHPNAARA